MEEPTLEDVRRAKDQLIQQLKSRAGFAGAGIGQRDGHLVLRVNWRSLPPEADRLQWLGNIPISHHEVGAVAAQSLD